MQGTKPVKLAYGLHCSPLPADRRIQNKTRQVDKLTLRLSDLTTQSVEKPHHAKQEACAACRILLRLAAGTPHQPNPNQTSGSLRHESGCTYGTCTSRHAVTDESMSV